MKIYTISGLGADKRVFDFLKLDAKMIHLDWIKNKKNESISSYAKRLSEKIDTNEPFILMGVSFGGLVAVEISKILKPKKTILISSVKTKNEIPLLYRIFGKTKLFNLVPVFVLKNTNSFINFMFGTKEKALLKSIMQQSDAEISKWAVVQLMIWKNEEILSNCIKVSGSKDKILPAYKIDDYIIENGGHLMIVDRADEISKVVNDYILNTIT